MKMNPKFLVLIFASVVILYVVVLGSGGGYELVSQNETSVVFRSQSTREEILVDLQTSIGVPKEDLGEIQGQIEFVDLDSKKGLAAILFSRSAVPSRNGVPIDLVVYNLSERKIVNITQESGWGSLFNSSAVALSPKGSYVAANYAFADNACTRKIGFLIWDIRNPKTPALNIDPPPTTEAFAQDVSEDISDLRWHSDIEVQFERSFYDCSQDKSSEKETWEYNLETKAYREVR